jgi:diguanylate cyclase
MGYGDNMVCDRGAFSGVRNKALQREQHGHSDLTSQAMTLPVKEPAFCHRVTPHEFLLHGRRVKRLAAAEARIAELESALHDAHENSIRDPLTGTFNRRGMNEMFSREAARAQRTGQPLTLALIDLDNFKSINDQHGHAVGDTALVHLTQVISKTLRPTDLCSRWGGNEFVVLMPGADCNFAKRILACVQATLAAEPVAMAPVNVAFSAGVVLSKKGESLEQMLVRADRAVYRAKAASKPRVFSG